MGKICRNFSWNVYNDGNLWRPQILNYLKDHTKNITNVPQFSPATQKATPMESNEIRKKSRWSLRISFEPTGVAIWVSGLNRGTKAISLVELWDDFILKIPRKFWDCRNFGRKPAFSANGFLLWNQTRSFRSPRYFYGYVLEQNSKNFKYTILEFN